MNMKVYVQPAMMVVELQHGMNILQYSRSAYGSGGSGYDDSDIGGRSGYGDGGSGYGELQRAINATGDVKGIK